jgi:phosphatidylserine decarboxylase
MGSTVILLFEEDKLNWLDDLKENDAIQVGQILANCK